MTDDDDDALRKAVIDSFKVVCICNKIKKGTIQRAIRGGAKSLDDVRRRTRAGTGPCKPNRCGPVIKKLLEETR